FVPSTTHNIKVILEKLKGDWFYCSSCGFEWKSTKDISGRRHKKDKGVVVRGQAPIAARKANAPELVVDRIAALRKRLEEVHANGDPNGREGRKLRRQLRKFGHR